MGDLSLYYDSLIQRIFVESAQNLTPEKSQGRVQSLAHNGHPSIWRLCLIVLNWLLRMSALALPQALLIG